MIFSFKMSDKVREIVTVSTPVDLDFEVYILEQAVNLLSNMITSKYATSYQEDLQELENLNCGRIEKKNPWRYKLALIHRVN